MTGVFHGAGHCRRRSAVLRLPALLSSLRPGDASSRWTPSSGPLAGCWEELLGAARGTFPWRPKCSFLLDVSCIAGSYRKPVSPWEQLDWENTGVSNIRDPCMRKMHRSLLSVDSEPGVPGIILSGRYTYLVAGTIIVPTAQGQEQRIREFESLSSVAQLVFVLVPGKGPVAPFYSFLAASLLIVESQNPEAAVSLFLPEVVWAGSRCFVTAADSLVHNSDRSVDPRF